MHRSAIALLLSAALCNADFQSPAQGENLQVNEEFTIQWDTAGLTEPLSINLVPAGPGDFVVAQQVGVDIANSGSLEFIPDASIANFDAFQFVLNDADGNSINSEVFQIDGLSQDPVEATVTLQSVQTIVATADGSEITQFVTSAREEVASIPADPIRLAVSGGETVNQVLTAAPLVQELSQSSGGVNLQSNNNEVDAESEEEDDNGNGFQVAGGVANQQQNQVQGGGLVLASFDPSLVANIVNPGDAGFNQIGGVGAQVITAEVQQTAEAAQTGIEGALSFSPVATPAVATAALNTLAGADPAAVTVGPLDVGATAQEGALTVAPLSGGLTPLGGGVAASAGGFTPLNAAASSANAANLAAAPSAASFNGANLVGGIGNSNGALTVSPLSTGFNGLSTGVPFQGTNNLAPSLGAPQGGSLLPGLSNTGGLGVPLATGTPLGGIGSSPLGGGLVAPTNPGLVGTGAVTLQTSLRGGTSALLPQATTSAVTVGAAGNVRSQGVVLAVVVGFAVVVML